jgi:hypothetical protein
MSLNKVWNENERFRLVFSKMLVFMPKTGFITVVLWVAVSTLFLQL